MTTDPSATLRAGGRCTGRHSERSEESGSRAGQIPRSVRTGGVMASPESRPNPLRKAIQPIGALALALVIAGIVIQITGGNPLAAFSALGKGAFGDTNSILRTLAKATPLLFSGLAVAVALR